MSARARGGETPCADARVRERRRRTRQALGRDGAELEGQRRVAPRLHERRRGQVEGARAGDERQRAHGHSSSAGAGAIKARSHTASSGRIEVYDELGLEVPPHCRVSHAQRLLREGRSLDGTLHPSVARRFRELLGEGD